jgi:hypothetical protein
MAVYKRGNVWWYKFNWNGETIREKHQAIEQANGRADGGGPQNGLSQRRSWTTRA